jgi:predicted nuclease with TOPRIM domain
MSSNFDLEHWQEVCYAHEAELQWLRAENAQLRKELTEAQKERAHQQGRATRNAKEYAAEQERTNRLRAENIRLRKALEDLLDDSEVQDFGEWFEDRLKQASTALEMKP